MRPDFRDLVGDGGTPEELAKLRRAHELLIAAGPPPELSPRLAEPPRPRERLAWWHERRNQAAFGLAATVAAAAFGVGYLVGDRGPPNYQAAGPPIPMHAVMDGSAARASIVIGKRDEVGNWPLLVHVKGLTPLPKNRWYELYLTRKGKPAAYCGSFSVNESGRTTVQFSIPYRLKGFDGWIVTRSGQRANKPVLLTT